MFEAGATVWAKNATGKEWLPAKVTSRGEGMIDNVAFLKGDGIAFGGVRCDADLRPRDPAKNGEDKPE